MDTNDRIAHPDAPYQIVPIVTPIAEDPAISGKIRHLPCSPTVRHKFLVSFVDDGGKTDYSVAPRYARQGYALLRDLFFQDLDLGEAGWTAYEKHLADIAAQRHGLKAFPEDKLPTEVRRRRARGRDVEPAKPTGKSARA